jgi:regulator of protease activity HflC (stomatin/prohibitin superfamily)
MAPAPSAHFGEIAGGAMLIAAFAMLVLERRYAATPESVDPQAPGLMRLCRVGVTGLLGLALAAGLRWLALDYARALEQAVAILTGLVAAEILLRSAVRAFLPMPPLAQRRSPADSTIAGLIRARPPSLSALNASVRNQFGIDLTRSWALGFIRRALLPLLGGTVLFVWLLTGVTALGINQRAVYEALGKPVAVFHAGLHLHLPWPLGTLRPVEYGVVHEMPIVFRTKAEPPPSGDSAIEAAAPPTADRLWDTSHEDEGSYLVASLSDGRQSFEAADIDISVAYRIGLDDRAAEDAVYRIAAPRQTIQALCGRLLARYFAHSTIAAILSQSRQGFVADFRKNLQQQLDSLGSGIEILAVVMEGVHPPAKAAASYQGVQAAAVESVTKVALARAEQAREMKMAELVARATRNDAISAAAERIGAAKADRIVFDGERQAYAAGGRAFLFERRLQRLDLGLADKPVILIDHRLTESQIPTIDMRGGTGKAASNLIPDDD